MIKDKETIMKNNVLFSFHHLMQKMWLQPVLRLESNTNEIKYF